jgi:hypothetical protein
MSPISPISHVPYFPNPRPPNTRTAGLVGSHFTLPIRIR